MAERYHLGVNRNEHPTMFVCREPACEIARHFYLAVDYDALAAEFASSQANSGERLVELGAALDRIRELETALKRYSLNPPWDRAVALEADRDQISLTLAVAKADRDKWFNRARELEKALALRCPQCDMRLIDRTTLETGGKSSGNV